MREAEADEVMRESAASISCSTSRFSSFTHWPTSRFDGPGAALSQESFSCVRMPLLRAIQRSRRTFHSLSLETCRDSLSTADFNSSAALSSAAGEKSASWGRVYMLFGSVPSGAEFRDAEISVKRNP